MIGAARDRVCYLSITCVASVGLRLYYRLEMLNLRVVARVILFLFIAERSTGLLSITDRRTAGCNITGQAYATYCRRSFIFRC